MKKIVVAMFLILQGCATAYMRDRECHDRSVEAAMIKNNDLMIGMVTNYDSSSFSFTFKNSNKSDIKIVWSESYFIGSDGTSKRLFADGKIADKSKPTPDTIVPTGSTIKSEAAVSDHVSYESGWKYAPLCGKSVSPLGKISIVGCDNLKLVLTYADSKSKYKAEFIIKPMSKLKQQCEGYNLETGEKQK